VFCYDVEVKFVLVELKDLDNIRVVKLFENGNFINKGFLKLFGNFILSDYLHCS